jgi:hypothetical protein
MHGNHDDVLLSEWERERLASIEGALAASDPDLTRRLLEARQTKATVAVATALVILGGVVAVMTFTRWLWLATIGLAVMALGAGVAVNPVVACFRRYRQAHAPGPPGG